MKRHVNAIVHRVVARLADRIAGSVSQTLAGSDLLADAIAHRLSLETMFDASIADQKPNEVFSGVSDSFWFWLCTEGYRRSPLLRNVLPGMPDENVQLQFNGEKGDAVLREAFSAYILFRDLYEKHTGPIHKSSAVMDFGC